MMPDKPTRRVLRSTGLLLAIGCIDPFAPPVDTYRFEPPQVYQAEWKSVEDCSGLSGDFNRVRWFGIPETPFQCGDGLCSGEWHAPHNIYIAQVFINDSGSHYFTVRHEMLHDLLGGGADHPPVFAKCGLAEPTLRSELASGRESESSALWFERKGEPVPRASSQPRAAIPDSQVEGADPQGTAYGERPRRAR